MKFEDIIKKINPLELTEKLGIEGRVQGKEFMAPCPFPDHEDSTPSFSMAISGPSKGLFQCFGCGSRGHVIHLVQRVLDIDREEAEQKLAEWFGLDRVIYYPTSKELYDGFDRKDEADEKDMVRIPPPRLHSNLEYTRNYIIGRGYTTDEANRIIERFGMGFCASGYYRDRIIIPIEDSTGEHTTFEATAISKDIKPKKLYPKGSPMGKLLFNYSKQNSSYIWLVEGVWDAVKLWSFGEPSVAAFGAKLSGHQARLLVHKFKKVYLLFDGDEAGEEATKKALAKLSPFVDVVVASLRYGDPDNLIKCEFDEMANLLRM